MKYDDEGVMTAVNIFHTKYYRRSINIIISYLNDQLFIHYHRFVIVFIHERKLQWVKNLEQEKSLVAANSSKFWWSLIRYGCENSVLNINHVTTLTFNARIPRTMETVYIWLVPALTTVLIRKMFSFYF